MYKKPKVLAQSTERMAECRPNNSPSGRPCNPPGPGNHGKCPHSLYRGDRI